jgi:hypothetical protein
MVRDKEMAPCAVRPEFLLQVTLYEDDMLFFFLRLFLGMFVCTLDTRFEGFK